MFTEETIKKLEELGMTPTQVKGQYTSEDFSVLCYDNEVSGHTGSDIQISMCIHSASSNEEVAMQVAKASALVAMIKPIIEEDNRKWN